MWDVCLDAIFICIQFFYKMCLDWGLAILIITLIFRIIITPLMYTQSKSTYLMQKVQPRIKQIQERFSDDPVRMNQETQKLYAEAKFNPLASCIPMLIQMPIFIALFQVLRGMAGTSLAEDDPLLRFHEQVVDLTGGGAISFYNIVPDLTQTPAGAWSVGFLESLPYVILLLIFALCTFIPSLLNMKNQDQQQKKTMMMMMFFMTIMMLFIGWGSPAGVLLFWGASSVIAIIQQQGSLAIVKKKAAEEESEIEDIPVNIEVTRKPKKKRQHKKR